MDVDIDVCVVDFDVVVVVVGVDFDVDVVIGVDEFDVDVVVGIAVVIGEIASSFYEKKLGHDSCLNTFH